jgi:hypothetical protein
MPSTTSTFSSTHRDHHDAALAPLAPHDRVNQTQAFNWQLASYPSGHVATGKTNQAMLKAELKTRHKARVAVALVMHPWPMADGDLLASMAISDAYPRRTLRALRRFVNAPLAQAKYERDGGMWSSWRAAYTLWRKGAMHQLHRHGDAPWACMDTGVLHGPPRAPLGMAMSAVTRCARAAEFSMCPEFEPGPSLPQIEYLVRSMGWTPAELATYAQARTSPAVMHRHLGYEDHLLHECTVLAEDDAWRHLGRSTVDDHQRALARYRQRRNAAADGYAPRSRPPIHGVAAS